MEAPTLSPPIGTDTEFTERLAFFIKQTARSRRQFAREIGDLAANVNNYCHGTNPPVSFLEKVARRYPHLDLQWLVCGVGTPQRVVTNVDEHFVANLIESFARERGAQHGVEFDHLRLKPLGGGLSFEASGYLDLSAV